MSIQPRDALIALSVIHGGDWNRIFAALKRHETPTDSETESIVSGIKCKTLTLLDEEYPLYLRNGCIRPPIVLYYYGDISLISDPCRVLTVVGSREPTPYAAEKTRELCREMVKRDYVLASGLAYGIDTIAAEEGLSSPGHAIGVLGCGIERMYPLENLPLRNRMVHTGLLLSEYPGRTEPDSKHFPLRNRILAALSKATFASEVKVHSGTSITVSYALQMNRDVGLLPFHVGEEEIVNNSFIKSGAALIEGPDDLVSMMTGTLRF